MKQTLTLIALTTLSATLACAQGTITFDTSIAGTDAKVLEAIGFPHAGQAIGNTTIGMEPGSHYLMQLYARSGVTTDSNSLVPISQPVNSRGGVNNSGWNQISGTTTLGWVVDTQITVPYTGIATVQLRAWWAGPTGTEFPTYYDVFHPPPDPVSGIRGCGSSFLTLTLGDPNANPPTTPATLVGLSGFILNGGICAPEPSAFALLCFGALGLLTFRRK